MAAEFTTYEIPNIGECILSKDIPKVLKSRWYFNKYHKAGKLDKIAVPLQLRMRLPLPGRAFLVPMKQIRAIQDTIEIMKG